MNSTTGNFPLPTWAVHVLGLAGIVAMYYLTDQPFMSWLAQTHPLAVTILHPVLPILAYLGITQVGGTK